MFMFSCFKILMMFIACMNPTCPNIKTFFFIQVPILVILFLLVDNLSICNYVIHSLVFSKVSYLNHRNKSFAIGNNII